jgi:hypothetical protein
MFLRPSDSLSGSKTLAPRRSRQAAWQYYRLKYSDELFPLNDWLDADCYGQMGLVSVAIATIAGLAVGVG